MSDKDTTMKKVAEKFKIEIVKDDFSTVGMKYQLLVKHY